MPFSVPQIFQPQVLRDAAKPCQNTALPAKLFSNRKTNYILIDVTDVQWDPSNPEMEQHYFKLVESIPEMKMPDALHCLEKSFLRQFLRKTCIFCFSKQKQIDLLRIFLIDFIQRFHNTRCRSLSGK